MRALGSLVRPRSGLALIVIVGILGITAILATCFITMARLERRASQQRVHATQAFLLARSGMEDLLARTARGQDLLSSVNRYAGEDWNANGALDGSEGGEELFRPGILNLEDCPLPQAMRPAFFVTENTGRPIRAQVDRRARGYSGFLGSSSGHYALKTTPQGGFYVNGGDPLLPSSTGYNQVLRDMLANLAEALDREDGSADGMPVARSDGSNLIQARPPGGWVSLSHVRDMALGSSQAKLDALSPYLALRAWVDRRVIRPVGDPGMAGAPYSWGTLKEGRAVPGFEGAETPPGHVVGRAPVDLAWARTRRPALLALLSGLSGQYLDQSVWTPDCIGILRTVRIDNRWLAADDCHVAAQAFLASTSDLGTWQRFNAFCDTIPFPATGVTELQAKRDILKANFNPNSDLNKFNPNPSLWKSVDKSDLLGGVAPGYTTEFSLLPLTGYEVQSLGRVLDTGGRLLAQRVLSVSVAGPSVVRLSTQREFSCEDLGNLEIPGDETRFRLPGFSLGSFPAYLSESQGLGRTWGHAQDTRGLSPAANYASGWMNGASRGAALQTYPEPCHDTTPGAPGTGLSLNPADYDGNLQLATVETQLTDLYLTTASPPVRLQTLLGHFDDAMDLDRPSTAPSAVCFPDVGMVSSAELGLSLLNPSKPNTLYPDGVYAERRRVPTYADRGSCDGHHGVLSFWVKPGYQRDAMNASLQHGHAFLIRTNALEPVRPPANLAYSYDQFFWLGDAKHSGYSCDGATLQFESTHCSGDYLRDQFNGDRFAEFLYNTDPSPQPRVWCLITVLWDFRSRGVSDVGRLVFNAGIGASTDTESNDYRAMAGTRAYWSSIPQRVSGPSWGSDITAPDMPSGVMEPHRLALGRYSVRDTGGTGRAGDADATLDELVFYDFGGAPLVGDERTPTPPGSLATVGDVARNRFGEGRYYKESGYQVPGNHAAGEAGSYVSAPIVLPRSALIQKLAWTWYRPADLPDDYAELELLGVGADRYLGNNPALSRSTRAPGWTRDRQDWDLGHMPSSPFRMRAVFRRDTPVPVATPILDSPVLDDLTILYFPGGSPRLLDWATGR